MDKNSYLACAGVVLMILEGSGDALSFTKELMTESILYKEALRYYDRRTAEQIEVKKLAANINAKPDILKFALPEAQGAMLYKLTESFWFSHKKGVLWDREEEQEDAILVILRNIQTKKEFRKVIERMTEDGSKGNFHSNIYRLTGLLDGSQFKSYLKHRGELAYLLQESNYPTLPASMQPIRQRVMYV